MKRVPLFLTTLIIAVLLLAACGGQETSTSLPSTNVPPVTMESTNTAEATEPAVTETAGTDMTTTPAVPVTGEDGLARVSNLIGTSVCGMGGDQIATVQDLVLDFDQTMVTYVLVDASGRNIAVPWTSLTVPTAGGTGIGTGTQAEATATTTGSTGADATATTTGGTGADVTATSTGGTGGTGTGATAQQDCLALTVGDDTLNNAPDFDPSTMPAQGQSAAGWDESLSGYWSGSGTGTGTGTGAATATSTTGTGTGSGTGVATATATTGTGTSTDDTTGQGAQQVQGVVLATDVLGSTIVLSPQGQGTGTGTGTGTQADATATASTPAAGATATGQAGTGTGTGPETTQGIVEDIIIEPTSGDMEYLVISLGTEDRWIPIPIGFLNWDATTNGFVLMISGTALQNAPAFSSDQFPDTSTEGWDQEWSDFWANNSGTGTGTGGVTAATATATP